MEKKLKLKCSCGEVEADLKGPFPDSGIHITCMCDDCQTAVKFLERCDLLDSHQGFEIYITTPDKINFLKGKENLASFKLSPKGVFRYYTKCCNTPIVNTINHNIPFAGISVKAIESNENLSKEELGPIEYRCMSAFSKNPPTENSHEKFPTSLKLKSMFQTIKNKFKKNGNETQFFIGKAPLANPYILTIEERNKIRSSL